MEADEDTDSLCSARSDLTVIGQADDQAQGCS